MQRVEGDGWKEALKEYKAVADDLHAGRTPREKTDGLTVADLCNRFLTAKLRKRESGGLGLRMFADYKETTDLLVATFGGTRPIDDLAAEDFEALRATMAECWGPVRLGNGITRVKAVRRGTLPTWTRPRPDGYSRCMGTAGVMTRRAGPGRTRLRRRGCRKHPAPPARTCRGPTASRRSTNRSRGRPPGRGAPDHARTALPLDPGAGLVPAPGRLVPVRAGGPVALHRPDGQGGGPGGPVSATPALDDSILADDSGGADLASNAHDGAQANAASAR